MVNKRFIVIAVLVSFFLAQPALAYLDPGTGSVLLQSLMASLAGALALLKLYWRRVKSFFLKLFGKSKPPINKIDPINK